MLKSSLLACLCATLPFVQQTDVQQTDAQQTAAQTAPAPSLLNTYKQIHAHPELSHYESNTSALLATDLRRSGYTVTDHIGIYPDGTHAFGVIGILKNGPGPTLLIRGDMDALPIVEETGLPYASHVTTKNKAGQEVGVMEACGHDIHTTVLMGTARALAADKSHWHGTLMILGQPSEETIDGAKAMLADHLYDRFGVPDMIIGLHDTNVHAAGTVGISIGNAMASSTSIDVTIRGIGGHGAYPNLGRDPILLSALFITQLQTIVSREEDPRSPSVVTVGSIHGGTKRNIIPDEVKLELTTRAFTEKSRQVILDAIHNMAAGLATSYNLPPAKSPTVTVIDTESAPATYNDPALSARVKAALVTAIGAPNVTEDLPVMGSEDVGVFALPQFNGGHKIPLVYYWLGAMNKEKFAAAQAAGTELPGYHTSHFEPDPIPTLETGVKTMTAAALALLQ
ncbi:M20 metallopeptidase family protein [Granulicella tundricola]|uniref:Amidohydrolase n=1 Tax=Granulicella tundricola (strain ATCC BAA-1859 / DSM 23138 / MP5ACTX9) TaxID=1198114 RepID=E8X1M6_GRATM|nr:amidohydrolase [Granulicella tundricola]ADW67945.1 amidohydrolase [Granulicella tundricola MP5ACTX9]